MTGGLRPAWSGESLSDADFAELARLLAEQRSFDLEGYKDGCIRRRIAKRLRSEGVTSVATYLQRLREDPDELDALLATISIHVSQFFRNPEVFQLLERVILPDLCRQVRAAGRDCLRLWSAGCAGGEEPYSLALLLDELNPAGLKIDILGTDISQPTLDAAEQAAFDRQRLKEVPQAVLHTYFQKEGEQFRLIERIRSMVRFERHNVVTAAVYPEADLILCRNVLIYFSALEQERILTGFAECLSPFGVLVLGRSEFLHGVPGRYFNAEYPADKVYRCNLREDHDQLAVQRSLDVE
ncbi:MAG: chemotaxis protein CheR [Desulfuromonas sp.]|nr:MAG: chemotaxis protein CheR [Desulfuromonas sp.]